MKNKITPFLFLLFCLSFTTIKAIDNITVLNPQIRWQDDQGTIEEASFTIHPRGVYMEVGMYLTVSAKSSFFANQEGVNLEAVLNFTLPENAIVHDSWLWIGEDIIQAKIIDKWTASTIYEDIVGRNRDPSILYKESATQYQLRIFPMESDSTRRVKVTYLMPADFTTDHISVNLPIQFLKTSKVPLEKIQIQAFTENEWENPELLQLPATIFEAVQHPNLGAFHLTSVPIADINSIDFAFKSPLKEGIYFSQLQKGAEYFYQLAFLPSEVFSIAKDEYTKVAIMLDYIPNNSTMPIEQILAEIATQLKQQLTVNDSFNIITSDPAMPNLSDTWISGSAQNIDAAFNNIDLSSLQLYSNQPSLFFKAVEFAKINPTNASLLLISNADQFRDLDGDNLLLQEITEQMGDQLIPVNVLDYQDLNYGRYWLGNQSYSGNQYFYTNISRLTAANYSNVRDDGNFTLIGEKLLTEISAQKGQMDIHTTLENGFCYNRYSNRRDNGLIPLNRAFVQVGQYQGTFPFIVQASGLISDKLYNGDFEITQSNSNLAAEKTATIWAGNHVNNLERALQDNATISEIVQFSIANRVLSLYTAFLALEVEQGGEICENCEDETDIEQVTATNEVLLDSLIQITASPNPFREQTTIKVSLSEKVNTKDISFRIYDILGRVVKTFNPQVNSGEKDFQFIWNGTNQNEQLTEKGIYFFNIETSQGQKNLKLLFIE